MRGREDRRRAFTLIEVMITVAILGILAALALPSLSSYVTRSKTSEATTQLGAMFKAAAAYYANERSGQGMAGAATGHCIVLAAGPVPPEPGPIKQKFVADAAFESLGFAVADHVYYSYRLTGPPPVTPIPPCGHAPNTDALYTLYANGDLDGDTMLSTFELAAGTDSSNTLFHARGIAITEETE